MVSATAARADVVLSPSTRGHFGAWLVAGPIPRDGAANDATLLSLSLHPAAGARLPSPFAWLTWSVSDGGGDALDLDRVFHSTKKGDHVLVAGVLDVPSHIVGWLLLSADGAVRVAIDGKVVWTRAAAHLRGGSWDPVAIDVGAGRHDVVFDLVRSDRLFAFDARVLEKATLEPVRGGHLRLPGASAGDGTRLLGRLARVELHAGLVPDGYQPRVRVEFPRGAPVDPAARFTATPFGRGAPIGPAVDLGSAAPDDRGVPWLEALLAPVPAHTGDSSPPSAAARSPDEIHVRRGGSEDLVLRTSFDPAACELVARALARKAKIERDRPAELSDVDVTVATLEGSMTRLARLIDERSPDVPVAMTRLRTLVTALEAGRDPLKAAGVLSLFRRSRFDGNPEPLRLHVPRSFDAADRKYPLVVVLHGLGSTPDRVMTAFLGSDADDPRANIDGFVLAPNAHGDAFYRGPGETDVLETIDWVVRNYPIDPLRISITGHSMGGTGAAHLAFRYPDRFTGVAALAGYHSYFVRRDVLGRPLRAWEWTELSRWSPASFAENGRDQFLLVAQGTSDLPLTHSRSLSERLHALGFPVEEAWPDIGHDVWRIVWDGGKLWPKLSARRMDPSPARVVLKTDSLRLGTRRWVSVTALDRYDTPASIDARIAAPERIEVQTSGVAAFTVARDAPRLGAGPVVVDVDGRELAFGPRDPIAVHRGESDWVAGSLPPAPGLAKRPGLEGPIRDAFTTPLAFVYGTLDPQQTRAAREVAEHFRRRWAGDAVLPVFADIALPAEVRRTHSLFLVGSRDSNRIVRELDEKLPLGIAGGAVRAGAARLRGDGELGFAAVFPNPENAARYVVTVEANDARGLFRALSLPFQLPDFIVYDSALAPAAGQQVLGDARVLAAGYFDRSWALPPSLDDAIALLPGQDPRAWAGPARAKGARGRDAAGRPPSSSGNGAAQAGAPRP